MAAFDQYSCVGASRRGFPLLTIRGCGREQSGWIHSKCQHGVFPDDGIISFLRLIIVSNFSMRNPYNVFHF